MARKIILRPIPPASTTPAFLSWGSISVVFARTASASLHTSCQKTVVSLVERDISLAFSAESLATVSIVPSTGFITALYAASTPRARAFAKSSQPASSISARPLDIPLNIRERITPEFPLAPLRNAEAAAAETSDIVELSDILLSSFIELPIVIDILVPVSPSGTG